MNYIKKAVFLILLFWTKYSFAQNGCTDPQANNYNPIAVTNDGSCTYPVTFLPLTFKCFIDSAELIETSGIVNQEFNYWTHVDDANNAIYRIDTLTDSIFQRVTIINASNIDWEDISSDSSFIYVGDVGNNDGNRTNLRFYRVRKSDMTGATTSVTADIISYSYADQVNFNISHNYNFYDCEAFFILNDSIHIFTKGWVNRWTKHYVLPAIPGTQVAQLVDSMNVNSLITSAAIQGDSLIVLLGLNFNGFNNCYVWMLSDFEGSKFFNGNKRRFSIGGFSVAGQAEGICFADTNRGYITNEGSGFVKTQLRQFNLTPYFTAPPPAPVLTMSANTIAQSLRACSDSGTASFTISNSTANGGRSLYFEIDSLPPWVTATPPWDTLSPGDSVTITFSFYSGSLAGGNYSDSIYLISNDPLQLLQWIPITMSVDSNPCINFTFISDSCSGITSFHPVSINSPTTYYWNFGDGDTSTVEEPVHYYSSDGNYIVTLICCNSSGCDTVIQGLHVAILSALQPANCYPTTHVYCCGRGITQFILTGPSGDEINNLSNDAVEGYEDFTCTDMAMLMTNYPYVLNCSTSVTDSEFLRIWLDMNNDGVLDPLTEFLFESLDTIPPLHSGTLTIPALPTNVYGVPLRMRIASDYQNVPQPCMNSQWGQHEDYAVVLNYSVGVNEESIETEFNIYPNPFVGSTNINIKLIYESRVSLEVFNAYGKGIKSILNKQQDPGVFHYNFNDLSAGIYYVVLIVNENVFVERLVKTH